MFKHDHPLFFLCVCARACMLFAVLVEIRAGCEQNESSISCIIRIMLCFICIKILIKNKCKYLHPTYEYCILLRQPDCRVCASAFE